MLLSPQNRCSARSGLEHFEDGGDIKRFVKVVIHPTAGLGGGAACTLSTALLDLLHPVVIPVIYSLSIVVSMDVRVGFYLRTVSTSAPKKPLNGPHCC